MNAGERLGHLAAVRVFDADEDHAWSACHRSFSCVSRFDPISINLRIALFFSLPLARLADLINLAETLVLEVIGRHFGDDSRHFSFYLSHDHEE
jgi:hypothetical protein